MPFLHCISSSEGTFYKNLQDTATGSFISCCFCSFYIRRYHFSQSFGTSFNIIWKKKRFLSQIFFFNRFTKLNPTPYPFNRQSLLSMTKVFCWCSLLCCLLLVTKSKYHKMQKTVVTWCKVAWVQDFWKKKLMIK